MRWPVDARCGSVRGLPLDLDERPLPRRPLTLATTAVTLYVALLASIAAGAETPRPGGDPRHGPLFLPSGVALPYPLDNLMRGWTPCTRRGSHRAIDIGGVGPDGGLGTPVRAMGRARVTRIGLPAEDPARYGAPLETGETTRRGQRDLPVRAVIPRYGTVHFFTRNYGSHRSGAVIGLEGLSGPLKGYTLTYMHLAAVRPGLRVGSVVEAGEEIGLMGGTAVQRDPPHLHLEIDHPNGRRVDPGRLLGIGPTAVRCRTTEATRLGARARYQKEADALMRRLLRGAGDVAAEMDPGLDAGLEEEEDEACHAAAEGSPDACHDAGAVEDEGDAPLP